MQTLVPVYRSLSRKACDERAFVLAAVNISGEILVEEAGFVLGVPSSQAALAVHHLWKYDNEQQPRVAPLPAPVRRFAHAWVGSCVYLLLLAAVMLAVVRGWGPPDLFMRGDLDSALVQQGQWWRAITALTLHVDIVHLVSNMGAGAVFGWLASRQLGAGSAWLLILLAAGLSNFIEGWLGVGSHRSVGASTAVFAALGLLAAHAWRTRRHVPQHWARRWAPLVAGIVVLGLLGTAGEGTNLVAHALGFVMGALGGALASQAAAMKVIERVPQRLAGAAALGLVALAWIVA